MSTSGSGGAVSIPISFSVTNMGSATYNNTQCTKYEIQIWSSDEAAHNSVSLTAPAGSWVDPTSVNVPATGYAYAFCYVPTTDRNAVTVTAGQTGYSNKSIPVQN